MGGAREYYMELRCLLYMAACMASFPLYRRRGTRRSIAWISTIICMITSFASVGMVFVLIWNTTLPTPSDNPGTRILRINGCLTGIVQATSLVFLSTIGIRKDGLHCFMLTLKEIRKQIKPRPSKESRVIFKIVNILAVIHLAALWVFVSFVNSGILPSDFADIYKKVFASFMHTEANFRLYMLVKSPFEIAASFGPGLLLYLFVTSAIMARREITLFDKKLGNLEPRLMTSLFLEEIHQNHESLLTLVSVTARIFSPYYSLVIACRLSSAVLVGFNAFYPKWQPTLLLFMDGDFLDLIVLNAVAIYINSGVSCAFCHWN